ncbi:MAG: IS110 family transposase [Candidatus Dormibacterales bacterium]
MRSREDAARKKLVVVGVDTHLELHVAVAIDEVGQVLGTLEIPTTPRGFRQLLKWATGFGPVVSFGVEGTGSYGAGLARFLLESGAAVVEVIRPNRQARRQRGKCDPLDAELAARSVLSGEARACPKRGRAVEMIKALRVARRSAVIGRAQVINEMKALVVTAPPELRQLLRGLNNRELVASAIRFRPGPVTSARAAVKLALSILGRRFEELSTEVDVLDRELQQLTATTSPRLLALKGVGTDVAGALLVAAGASPERLRSEGSFAKLCGVAPLPASSGKTVRHRLNRGGDRSANNALWRIAMVRMSSDPRTQAYVARRTQQGLSKPEIVRCLKRYIAREVFAALTHRPSVTAVAAKAA